MIVGLIPLQDIQLQVETRGEKVHFLIQIFILIKKARGAET